MAEPVTVPFEPNRLILERLRYHVATLISDLEFQGAEIEVRMDYRLEAMAHHLLGVLHVTGAVLQDNRVIAEYPATLWDHIKQRLGMKHRVVTKRLTEHLLFPDVVLAPGRRQAYVYYTST